MFYLSLILLLNKSAFEFEKVESTHNTFSNLNLDFEFMDKPWTEFSTLGLAIHRSNI